MAKKRDEEAKHQRRVGDSGVCAKGSKILWSRLLTCSSGGGDASKSAQQLGEMAETHNVIRPLGRCTAADRGSVQDGQGWMCRVGVHGARGGRRREWRVPACVLNG